MLVLTVITAFTFTSVVFADTPSFSVINNILNLSLSPGQSHTSTVTVVNESSTIPISLQVEVVGLGQGTDGSNIALTANEDKSPYSARTFTSIDTTSMQLQPGASQNVNVTVAVPGSTESGEYYAGIYIYGQLSNQGNVGQVLASIVPIILTVQGFTPAISGKITEMAAPQNTAGETLEIDTTLENTGNCLISVPTSDTVTLYSSTHSQISQDTVQLASPSILPTFSRTFKAYFNDQPAGSYSATSVIITGAGTQLSTQTLNFAITVPSTTTTGAQFPEITSFSPTSGGPGTAVNITGSGFTGAINVSFNNVGAQSFTVNSDTQITAIVGNGASGKISVTTGGGTTISLVNFTFVAPQATITSFSPTSGGVGTAISIVGTNFTGATAVEFGTNNAGSYTINSAAKITAVVPNLGTGNAEVSINVITLGGTVASSSVFSYTAPPSITSFSPTSGNVGTSVSITGMNFTGATAVEFGANNAQSYAVNSNGAITAVVPNLGSAGASAAITVIAPGGTTSSSSDFSYTVPNSQSTMISSTTASPKLPSITSFTPTSGGSGSSITISGTNFTGVTQVIFGTVSAASYAVNSDNSITAVVPNLGNSNAEAAVTVVTAGGMAISNGNFAYTASEQEPILTSNTSAGIPNIVSFTPTSGAPGIAITILGSGFTGATAVQFGANDAGQSFSVISDDEITAIVPNLGSSNTVAVITVTAPGGTAISSGNFSYLGSGGINVSTDVTPFNGQAAVQNTGISWSIVGIVIAPIIIIGLIIFAIMGNRRRNQKSGDLK
jgi:hypothetical protein